LELNTGGSLTVTNAMTVGTGNTVKLDGPSSTLTDAAGVTINSTGLITGQGIIAASTALSGTGTVKASGGTLDLKGTVNSGVVLAVDTTANSDLKIENTATAAAAITLNNANQTVEIATGGSLTINAAQSASNGTIKLSGGTLTDASGITLTSPASLTGFGTVAANTAISGTGTIKASSGTLDLLGTVNSGPVLVIDTTASSDLKIDGTATAAAAITLNNANQTLEIGSSGSLTISAAQSATNATIQLDGGTLTDASGLTIGSSASLTGKGKVSANITTSAGTITASGGTLEVNGTVTNATLLQIGSGTTDTLKLDGVSSATTVTFLGSTGTLEVNTAGTLTVTNALSVGANTVLLDGAGSTLTDSNGISLTGGTISGAGSVAANTNISGSGTVAISISTAGSITASAGTLDLTGTVSGRNLVISTGSASTLKIDGTATSSAAAITLNNANQTLEIGSTGSLTIGPAESATNGTIKLSGGTITDSNGISLTSPATLMGSGTVASGTTLSGTGTVTASSGTLELKGSVVSGVVLAIDTTANSDLKISATATSATAIALTNANQTLEIGSGGNVTVNAAMNATAGTIKMNGGLLKDTSGITLGSAATMFGQGIVQANLSGTGTVEASGIALALQGSVASGVVLQIDSSVTSYLVIEGTAVSAAAITLNNSHQVLRVNPTGNLTINAAQTVTNTTLSMVGGTLTDAAGIILGAGGGLGGTGTISANTALSGTGTVSAGGGLLDLKGTVNSGLTLSIETATVATLKIDGTAVSAAAMSLTSANQTLEIGASGSLTINAAQSVTSAAIKMDGGTLTDASGITLTSPATLIGFGTVAANTALSGTGTVEASGGTLDLLGNLEIGATGNLTINQAQSKTGGAIQLDGGTLTDSSGLTLNFAKISGSGTVVADITGSDIDVNADGGTLELNGSASGIFQLRVDGGAQDRLKLDGATTATQLLFFSASAGTVEVDTGGSLTVSTGIMVASGNTVQLDGAASILTDAGGIDLTGGTISGLGTIAAGTDIIGYGTVRIPISTAGSITASGGTLDLSGALSNRTLVISSTSASTLKIDGTATSAAAITLNSSNQTLEVGSTGNLTIDAAESASDGTIKLSGGTISDASGISLTSPATLTGEGTVAADLSGTGTVTAKDGTLDLTGTVNSGVVLAIYDSALSTLKIDGSAVSATAISMDGVSTLEIGATGNLTINQAQSKSNGTIQLDGGTLTDSSGLTLHFAKIFGSGDLPCHHGACGHDHGSGRHHQELRGHVARRHSQWQRHDQRHGHY
jgi:hypothetical protein